MLKERFLQHLTDYVNDVDYSVIDAFCAENKVTEKELEELLSLQLKVEEGTFSLGQVVWVLDEVKLDIEKVLISKKEDFYYSEDLINEDLTGVEVFHRYLGYYKHRRPVLLPEGYIFATKKEALKALEKKLSQLHEAAQNKE